MATSQHCVCSSLLTQMARSTYLCTANAEFSFQFQLLWAAALFYRDGLDSHIWDLKSAQPCFEASLYLSNVFHCICIIEPGNYFGFDKVFQEMSPRLKAWKKEAQYRAQFKFSLAYPSCSVLVI